MGFLAAEVASTNALAEPAQPTNLVSAADTWKQKHIHKLDDDLILPIAAICAFVAVPIFCLICMKLTKEKKGAPAPCDGWGPCIFFGSMVLAFWIYTSLEWYPNYYIPTFRAD